MTLIVHDLFAWQPILESLNERQFRAYMRFAVYASHWPHHPLDTTHLRFCGIRKHDVEVFLSAGLIAEKDGTYTLVENEFLSIVPEPSKQPRTEGFTYLIQGEHGGPVKIGSTRGAPEQRLRALQTGHHERLVIRAVIPSVDAETELHQRFAAHRLSGEWFSEDAPGLADLMDAEQ